MTRSESRPSFLRRQANEIFLRLYSDLVTDSLSEYSYDADLAGLTYNFASHTAGLYISMHGYNDKMSVLVEHVLDRVKHLVIDPQRLIVLKEQVRYPVSLFIFVFLNSITGEKGMGKLLPRAIIHTLRLLWTLFDDCKAVDSGREAQRIIKYESTPLLI